MSPSDVVGDQPQTRNQCTGLRAGVGSGELPDGFELALAAPGHGVAGPGSAQRSRRSRRNLCRGEEEGALYRQTVTNPPVAIAVEVRKEGTGTRRIRMRVIADV